MTRMSGHPRTALVQAAREVADRQAPAGPLEPGDEPRNPEPGTSRRALHGQGEVLVGIDGETARLYLVDTGAGDELAELVHLPLLPGGGAGGGGPRAAMSSASGARPIRWCDAGGPPSGCSEMHPTHRALHPELAGIAASSRS